MIAADHTPAEVPTVRPATEAAELKKKTASTAQVRAAAPTADRTPCLLPGINQTRHFEPADQ
jgi:hypothetical protein